MENNNIKSKNPFPKLEYYERIINNFEIYSKSDYHGCEPFDLFKMENKEEKEKENSLGSYLATSNKETKNIDIYKIYSQFDIQKIYSIEVKYNDIHSIKYFYDLYDNIHYLTALINEKTNILIWKIEAENKYELIANYKDDMLQGGYSRSIRPIKFNCYMLFFNKEQSLLILVYNVSRGCTCKVTFIEKYDFINYKKLEKFSESSIYYSNRVYGYIINIGEKIYFGLLNLGMFFLYDIFPSNLNNLLDEEEGEEKDCKSIKFKLGECPDDIKNIVIMKENNEDKYLYYNKYYKDNNNNEYNFIGKIDLINKEYLFEAKINIGFLFSMTNWNKNYLLLFEYNSFYIYILNLKTFQIQAKLFSLNNNLYNGKKFITKDNEELLFVTSGDGLIYLWINDS